MQNRFQNYVNGYQLLADVYKLPHVARGIPPPHPFSPILQNNFIMQIENISLPGFEHNKYIRNIEY